MTYKLGPFYLTTVTFPNPMFAYKNNVNKHPTTLAAVMTSVSKETRDYEYLARSLKSEGIESLMYGTDGECALESGFESVYPISESTAHSNIHLRCFDHAKGSLREFKEWMLTTKGRHRSMKTTLKLCMLKSTRIAAGLGNPPNKWDNQRTESLNNVIKEAAENQVTDQASILETLESDSSNSKKMSTSRQSTTWVNTAWHLNFRSFLLAHSFGHRKHLSSNANTRKKCLRFQ